MDPYDFHFATLEECGRYGGTVVVIDVCRAFTTAAYAFGSGVERILLAGTVEEALALRRRFPGSLVMGEVGGMPVDGFDLWNSPAQVSQTDLRGKTLIQRTSSGTQGVVRSTQATRLLAASFAVAGATVQAIRQAAPAPVTFVITGKYPEDPRFGQEDRACADYMAALLRGEMPDPQPYLTWLDDFKAVHRLAEWPEPERSQFMSDLALCTLVDRFPYALEVRREDDLLIMDKVNPFDAR